MYITMDKENANQTNNNLLPRLFISENQEFVIEGQIFIWYFSNPELRTGLVLYKKGVIEPQIISVTTVSPKK